MSKQFKNKGLSLSLVLFTLGAIGVVGLTVANFMDYYNLKEQGVLYSNKDVPVNNEKQFKSWYNEALSCNEWVLVKEELEKGSVRQDIRCKSAQQYVFSRTTTPSGKFLFADLINDYKGVRKIEITVKGKHEGDDRVTEAVAIDRGFLWKLEASDRQGWIDSDLFDKAWRLMDREIREIKAQ